ncbi:MAG: YigZ family protein, partial [Treponema sp.]|nr:YigZ family protein [Treponema sp.]
MQTVKENVTSEIIVKNSRFIAELFPCTLQSDVRNLIKEQKKLYKDARHVVHAFIIGSNAEIKGASDDGEPSGTAGRPILSVLQGNNFTNVLLTVTRYFGGTLLGTGGLVKAYSDAAKLVIKNALDNGLLEELISLVHFSFSTDYANY